MTAGMAFQFCVTYKRTTEFRRLCDTLRNHLANLNKCASCCHPTNAHGGDTDTAVLHRPHLQMHASPQTLHSKRSHAFFWCTQVSRAA